MPGYNPAFIPGCRIPLPQLTATQKRYRAPLKDNPRLFELAYTHFSIVMHKVRRFAFFAACNIDGSQWQPLLQNREKFMPEPRLLPAYQTGNELYDLHSRIGANDFDKGHLVKLQDPQWGDAATISKAATDTMFFANCVPQHHSLNRGAWKSLEDYIVKNFTLKSGSTGQRVSVFAGPMLLSNDPFYIDRVQGEIFRIPVHFWKVVVYRNRQDVLSAVAFLMSQRAILLRQNFVVEKRNEVRETAMAADDYFTGFKKGEPYQVTLSFLEKTTGYKFGLQQLHQPYTKEDPTEIVFRRIEVIAGPQAGDGISYTEIPLPFEFRHIRL